MRINKELYAFPWKSTMVNNCNSYFIDGDFKILIDPGHNHLFRELQHSLESIGVQLEDINLVIVTHGHPDHIEAVKSFSGLKTMVAINEVEYRYFQKIASGNFDFTPDFFLLEGKLNAGEHDFEIIYTPGHSPGSICIYWPCYGALFSGDVVFEYSVGRTDLHGGDISLLKKSVQRLSSLNVELLLPGHGNIISGKREAEENFSLIKRMYFNTL